ncbi:terpene synthase family protein [Streptomyces sp. NPDC088180]|uniref:terpene synthase family protein n=1 Tax=Streptomyces sp. NPDC088180 TaxID=3365837 RepID=UPI003812F521
MRETASHVVAWVNAPYSAPKEIRLSDFRNYVVALTSKLDVSLQEAADLVAQRFDIHVGRAPRRREPRRGRPPPAARRPPSPHRNGRRTQDLDDRQRPLGRGTRPLHRPRDPATGPVQHLATLI